MAQEKGGRKAVFLVYVRQKDINIGHRYPHLENLLRKLFCWEEKEAVCVR